MIAGQPPAGGVRSGDALGGTGRPDSGQLRSGHPRTAPRKREPRADQKGNRGDLESLRGSRPPRPAKNFGRMVRFLLVTAQRRDEAASLRVMVISSTASGGRPRTRRADRIASRCRRWRWLWSARARRGTMCSVAARKIGAFSKLKRKLDEASGVTDWRLHDLRRTAASQHAGPGHPQRGGAGGS